jgi:hypothetical protein
MATTEKRVSYSPTPYCLNCCRIALDDPDLAPGDPCPRCGAELGALADLPAVGAEHDEEDLFFLGNEGFFDGLP